MSTNQIHQTSGSSSSHSSAGRGLGEGSNGASASETRAFNQAVAEARIHQQFGLIADAGGASANNNSFDGEDLSDGHQRSGIVAQGIRDQLEETGILGDVSNRELKEINGIVDRASPAERNRAIANLSNSELSNWTRELNNAAPFGPGGLSQVEKNTLYDDLSQGLDSQQLDRFYESLDDNQQRGQLIDAIGRNASDDTKAEFIQALGERTIVNRGEDNFLSYKSFDPDALNAAELLNTMKDPAKQQQAYEGLSDDQLQAIFDAAAGEQLAAMPGQGLGYNTDTDTGTNYDSSTLNELIDSARDLPSADTQARVFEQAARQINNIRGDASDSQDERIDGISQGLDKLFATNPQGIYRALETEGSDGRAPGESFQNFMAEQYAEDNADSLNRTIMQSLNSQQIGDIYNSLEDYDDKRTFSAAVAQGGNDLQKAEVLGELANLGTDNASQANAPRYAGASTQDYNSDARNAAEVLAAIGNPQSIEQAYGNLTVGQREAIFNASAMPTTSFPPNSDQPAYSYNTQLMGDLVSQTGNANDPTLKAEVFDLATQQVSDMRSRYGNPNPGVDQGINKGIDNITKGLSELLRSDTPGVVGALEQSKTDESNNPLNSYVSELLRQGESGSQDLGDMLTELQHGTRNGPFSHQQSINFLNEDHNAMLPGQTPKLQNLDNLTFALNSVSDGIAASSDDKNAQMAKIKDVIMPIALGLGTETGQFDTKEGLTNGTVNGIGFGSSQQFGNIENDFFNGDVSISEAIQRLALP